ncbi:Hypothetical predicted protein [Mytilus galloprovincialis]|uniref:Uncharacterized protein n=1 Tax=Mytilus galloprovincialis TaxID=29158 RepID=A0A8B6BNP3_MYTGA|nr:Hypothetical predicted protein [Mytilus galloprovincialis]
MENSSFYILHSSDSYGHLDERSMFNSSISSQNTTNSTAGFRTEVSFHDVIISKETLQTMKLVFGIILLFPVSALGIFGNAISLIVLCQQKGAINSLLQLAWKGYSRLGKSRNFQQLLSYITFLLEATNSALNFVIYMALSARFYAKYKEIFFSAKAFIRQVSVHSFSRGKSSFAIHKKCDSQSSFTYSEDPANQRLTNKITNYRNDSYKSLLQHSGNGQCSKGRNSTKINQPPNGTLYELSEKSKTSLKAADSSSSRKYFILDQSESESDNIKLPPLVKQDTLETNIDP